LERAHASQDADARPLADEVATEDAGFHVFAIPASPTAADAAVHSNQPENTNFPEQDSDPAHTAPVHDQGQPTAEHGVEENIRFEAQSLVGARV
jgi:hypothetical protein